MKYKVWFTQYWGYEVEAEDEDVAFDLALEDFHAEMRRPIAHTCWDDVEITEVEEE